MPESPYETLLDYRRRVSDLYHFVRQNQADDPAGVWRTYRELREELFLTHPQSALDGEQKARFKGLPYYDYDPAWRLVVPVDADVAPEVIEVPLQEDGLFRMQRFGRVAFKAAGQAISLSLYWVLGYGGGVFLPFRDATNRSGKTYGGGRYLLDTIKHADLGHEGDQLVLDFNYAYNPSCAYNARWHCPLPPQENWVEAAIPAGEKSYPDAV